MNKPLVYPPYPSIRDGANKIVLPVTLAIVGASAVLMAVMLLTSEKKSDNDEGNYDVENYDVVGNTPYIYSICE